MSTSIHSMHFLFIALKRIQNTAEFDALDVSITFQYFSVHWLLFFSKVFISMWTPEMMPQILH